MSTRPPARARPSQVAFCDLASLEAVRQFAESCFTERERELHVLVNNAGVLPSTRQRTRDGFELTFATNVLAPFLLTHLLGPRSTRTRSAPTSSSPSSGLATPPPRESASTRCTLAGRTRRA